MLCGSNVQANQEKINVKLLDEVVTQLTERFIEE
jgi:hypothetical protein